MVRMHFEVEGDVDEVVRFLGHLGVRGGETVRGPDGRQIAATEQYRAEDNPVSEPAPAASTPAPLSGGWTEELAADSWRALIPWPDGFHSTSGGPVQRASIGAPYASVRG